jgi:hypothetical protein
MVTAPHYLSQMHTWYLGMSEEFLPIDFDKNTRVLLSRFVSSLENKDYWTTDVNGTVVEHLAAYAVPLGFAVPVQYEMDVGQYAYLAELRSGVDVHPTLRRLIQDAHATIKTQPFPIFVDNRLDPGIDGFNMRRGNQTILVNGDVIQ